MKTPIVLLLAATSLAHRVVHRATPADGDVAILEKIAPTSNTCAGADAPTECATATQAVQPLLDSFAKYKITTPGEQAALIALMAFESVEFKFVRNKSPGRPGQGCRNMMMPNFVGEFAQSLGLSGADEAGTLDAVINAGEDWAAAGWFYTTKCSSAIQDGLKAGTRAGFEAYMSECIGAPVGTETGDNSRIGYWQRAATAVGLSGN